MRILLTLVMTVMCCLAGMAQVDSISLSDRQMAQAVLAHFDTIAGPRLLYSVVGLEYCVTIKTGEGYREFVLKTDSASNILYLNELHTLANHKDEIAQLRAKKHKSSKDKQQLQWLKDEQRALSQLFAITHLDSDAPMIFSGIYCGRRCYLIIKDANNNTVGEYWFNNADRPSSISNIAWSYVVMNSLSLYQ